MNTMKKQMIAFGLTGLILAGCASSGGPQLTSASPVSNAQSCPEIRAKINNNIAAVAAAGNKSSSSLGEMLNGLEYLIPHLQGIVDNPILQGAMIFGPKVLKELADRFFGSASDIEQLKRETQALITTYRAQCAS